MFIITNLVAPDRIASNNASRRFARLEFVAVINVCILYCAARAGGSAGLTFSAWRPLVVGKPN
jgi:hypothetical protein